MALASALFEILQRPTLGNVFIELMMFMAPLWIAVIFGVFVGWAWKPRWAANPPLHLTTNSFPFINNNNRPSFSSSPSSADIVSTSLKSFKSQLPSCFSWLADDGSNKDISSVTSSISYRPSTSSSSKLEKEKANFVAEDDLEHLCQLVEEKDGGLAWIQVMDRSTSDMSYQAWRRDPEIGPPEYRSRTVYEDTDPELMRDFFWDDEFRMKWDDMLLDAETLEECPTTGTMVVKWVRKFPFFCSDREYIIGRRIWESGRSYYCVTKGVPYPSVPRRNKPRRVDLYYSSWCIRAVESRRGDGQLTSCEVVLFHHEDMGIPWELAKLGVRQGMWGAVKKIDRGLRAYQRHRATGAPLSHCALMAHINAKVSSDYLRYLESTRGDSQAGGTPISADEKPVGRNIPKLLVIGGAIALACTIDRGLLTKAVIFGVARRFAKIGRRL